jgi:hypothetical protein
LSQLGASGNGFRDKLLLFASAILVCVIGVNAVLFAEDHHANKLSIFFGLNAIGFIAVVGRKFPKYWRNPLFILFFLVWLVVHGIVSATLATTLPILYWPPIFAAELFVGFLAAYLLFGVPPSRE